MAQHRCHPLRFLMCLNYYQDVVQFNLLTIKALILAVLTYLPIGNVAGYAEAKNLKDGFGLFQ
jgi:hypothetical protein